MVDLAVFIPIYNEVESLKIIDDNIFKLKTVFPQVHFYISDNASTDGTWEGLKDLEVKWQGILSISRNSQNLGFAKNLFKSAEICGDSYILISGANDMFNVPGLKRLLELLTCPPEFDFYIFNWAYIRGDGDTDIILKGDIKSDFTAISLDDYFSKHRTVPNGIMQYVAKVGFLSKMAPYLDLHNPQSGAFLDSFPCKVLCVSTPISLVNYVEPQGWRSSKETIFSTHVNLVKEIFLHIEKASLEKRISFATMTKVKRHYLKIITYMYVMQLLFTSWGTWKLKGQDRIIFLKDSFKGMFRLYSVNTTNYRFKFCLDLSIATMKKILRPFVVLFK